MRNLILLGIAASMAVVSALPEPPVDEPLEGPRHYPELLPRVRDLLIYDNPPVAVGSPSPGSFSGAYGAPGGSGAAAGPGSFGRSPGAPKEVILADPELAPLLSTFDLSPSVEKRSGSAGSGGCGSIGTSGQNSGISPFGAPGAGGYN